MRWNVAHLMALAAWGGLVAGEMVMEVLGRQRPHLQRPVAELHRVIDIYVEVPVLIAVGLTGMILLSQRGGDAGLMLKIAAGAAAISFNLMCVGVVVRRADAAQAGAEPGDIAAHTQTIFRLAGAGFLCACVAFALGAHRTGWF